MNIIIGLSEIAAAVFLVWGLFNEQKLAQAESRIFRRHGKTGVKPRPAPVVLHRHLKKELPQSRDLELIS